MWLLTGGWAPPLGYRRGDVPLRNVVTRTEFQVEDPQETARLRDRARTFIRCIYRHDPQIIPQLLQTTQDKFFQLAAAKSLKDVDPELWKAVTTLPIPSTVKGSAAAEDNWEALARWADAANIAMPVGLDLNLTLAELQQLEFASLQQALSGDSNLKRLEGDIREAFSTFQRDGLLDKIQHDDATGIATEIQVAGPVVAGEPAPELRQVWVQDVLVGEVTTRLRQRLLDQIESPLLAQSVYNWLKTRLPTTLTLDSASTRDFAEKAAEGVPPFMITYKPGDLIAYGGLPLDEPQMKLLQAEHAQMLSRMKWDQKARFGLAKAGMFVACFTLCGWYLFVRSRHLLGDNLGLIRMLVLAVLTVLMIVLVQRDRLQAEMVPLLLFSMTMVIAYQQELAILLSATMALVTVLVLGRGLTDFVVLLGAMAVGILMLRQLRYRTRLLYVGVVTGVAAACTTLGIYSLTHSPSLGIWEDPAGWSYLSLAGRYGLHAALAGLIMTGLLPFVERAFDVQTELSLLELGDVAHPLLQELVRRAPGTFNHSMNVASIAEAAAESINANGLLVRVGAYFHDIGKMLKPSYFVENQPRDENRHESLLPAMSTLIIISHVKDGADLARAHNLPNAVIDFIRQHHGTTLVEYFYHRASEQSGQDRDSPRVEEGTYRYPGPKPRTKEAAVLMLADAVEGAGRTLTDPTPAKIEGLVHDLAMKRLLDGQFDECGLTLRELKKIEVSLIKSLSAICHGRIRYPDQQAAALPMRA